MKKLFCISVLTISTLFFVGCNGKTNETTDNTPKPPAIEDSSNVTDNNSSSNSENKDDSSKHTNGTNTNSGGNSENSSNNNSGNSSNNNSGDNAGTGSNEVEDKTERIFKITTKDIDYNVVSGGEIKTIGLGVADNITKILETISKKYFDSKALELSRIDTINNKKIAVINLTGDEKYWHEKMQGSAGGTITEYTLIENILQRNYKGYWIDGVKFTLNGNPLSGSSHSPNLSKTTYR